MKLVAAVLMLLTLGALGEVVMDLNACKQFFLKEKPPVFGVGSTVSQVPIAGDRFKKICQKYQGTSHYATLYDTAEKIPVYSAYQYQRTAGCTINRPDITWMIEAQIEGRSSNVMELLGSGSKGSGKQAYNSDYDGARYDRGHLYPHCHAPSKMAAESTFTLTNAAPQRCDFNKFWYSKVEDKVRDTLKSDCVNKGYFAYVVTGVVQSSGTFKVTVGKGQVNVPTHFWTAYCCCDQNNKNCKFEGYIMYREDDEPDKPKTPDDFDKKLKDLYSEGFQVFPGKCI
ncbi:endonuclease domain-containing 1 protein-like [Salminus brasiliensis]|uniref:endonuclease domain-containing 1 protein-like n=1 Tax=Salminus brasiliensis TaxID=930266 RepID=UPI003B833353